MNGIGYVVIIKNIFAKNVIPSIIKGEIMLYKIKNMIKWDNDFFFKHNLFKVLFYALCFISSFLLYESLLIFTSLHIEIKLLLISLFNVFMGKNHKLWYYKIYYKFYGSGP